MERISDTFSEEGKVPSDNSLELELYSVLKKAAEDGSIKVTSEVSVKDGEAYELVTYELEGENGKRLMFATSTSLDPAYAEKAVNPDKVVTIEDTFGECEISLEDIAPKDITEEETDALLYQASWSAITQAKRDYISYLSESHGETQLEPIDFLRTSYGLSEEEIKHLFPTEYHETAFLNHLAGARRSIADPDPHSLERKRKERLSTAHTSRFGKIAGAGKRLVPVAIAGGVLYLGTGVPVGAVTPPNWDTTWIYDQWDNDPPSDAGTYGVPSIVPIVIKGYNNEPVELKITALNGSVVCQGVSHPDGNYERIYHCPQYIADEGKYIIKLAGNDLPIDFFKLDVAAPPVPEVPTWVLMALGLLTLLGYREYSKKKNSE